MLNWLLNNLCDPESLKKCSGKLGVGDLEKIKCTYSSILCSCNCFCQKKGKCLTSSEGFSSPVVFMSALHIATFTKQNLMCNRHAGRLLLVYRVSLKIEGEGRSLVTENGNRYLAQTHNCFKKRGICF